MVVMLTLLLLMAATMDPFSVPATDIISISLVVWQGAAVAPLHC